MVYHSIDHTLEILYYTEMLAEAEHVKGKDLTLLKTAALMHDLGYADTHVEHEEVSCSYVQKWLPEFGFNGQDIDKVNAMIMATRIPQSPKNILSEILCDADLYYLGGSDYEEKAALLFAEMKNLKTLENEDQWLQIQIEFLSSHTFFTETGKRTRNQGKQNNLDELLAKQKSIKNE